MKPRFTIISIICCLPLFTSCLGTITVQYDNEPVARGYVFSDRINCDARIQNGLATFYLVVDEEDESVRYYHKGDEEFNKLSLKHKDSFSGRLIEGRPGVFGHCLAMDFTSIDIVCDKDYDELHPAGSSLADIVTYEAISIFPWIKSGYKSQTTVYCISKPLSKVEPDDMTMIFPLNFRLSLRSRPQEKSDYSFHITLKTYDGLVYEIDQDVTF